MHKEIDRLSGKKILLIALPGYSNGMVKKLREMGAEVTHINDKPNDGVICKTLGRMKVKAYQEVIHRYYVKKIMESKKAFYDVILVIRGEYTPEKTLLFFREKYPAARLILYMWDSLRNNRGIEKKWKYYDQVYTFDRMDYLHHKGEIAFLPLYYYEDYLPKETGKNPVYRYDVSFIGTGHADRIRIVKDVVTQCRKNGYKCGTYFYLPHKLVYLYNKLTNRDFKRVRMADVHFSMLSFEKVYYIYSQSRCVIDVESRTQSGLTMRCIEMIGLKRKLITTNADIVHYDFYDPNNILVIDRKQCRIDPQFFDRPYQEPDPAICHKYSLENWLLEVLK